ncbi:MAG: hypothetical protein IKV54_01465 [Clostridia bacterium]|nr:hypothetical protein [Clostridia bacterium]
MNNKNILFFLIKLLILLITNVAMIAVYLVVGAVLGVLGIDDLLGEGNTAVVRYGVTFLVFLIYTMMQVRRFKVNREESFGVFLLKECAVYAAFCLPLFAVAMAVGVSGIPGWLTVFYSPHMLMYRVSGIAAVGYGVPLIVYAAIVTAVRLAVLAKHKDEPAAEIDSAEETAAEEISAE